MDTYEQALRIAATAHAGQTRKNDDTPYITHPIMVARILEEAGFSKTVVCAALVHDVLEDTSINEEALRALLGNEIVDIVTGVSEDKSLPWEERKAKYIHDVAAASETVWAVSVADKIHNARDFIHHHQNVGAAAWQIFNRGKDTKIQFEKNLYQALASKWNHPLLETYAGLITELQMLDA